MYICVAYKKKELYFILKYLTIVWQGQESKFIDPIPYLVFIHVADRLGTVIHFVRTHESSNSSRLPDIVPLRVSGL